MERFSGIDPDQAIRRLLSDAMSKCGKSREAIASELSRRLGRRITASILNDYTATTKTSARFPAAYIDAFCDVTDTEELRRFCAGKRIQELVALGEAELQLAAAERAKLQTLARFSSEEAFLSSGSVHRAPLAKFAAPNVGGAPAQAVRPDAQGRRQRMRGGRC